jgi:hypothetical protein
MADVTSPDGIPYPTQAEPPNGPAQMGALATKVQQIVVALRQSITDLSNAVNTKNGTQDAAINKNAADIAVLGKVRFGSTILDFSAQGTALLPHTLGVTPTTVLLTPAQSESQIGISLTIDSDVAMGPANVGVLARRVDTGALYGGQVRVHWGVRA